MPNEEPCDVVLADVESTAIDVSRLRQNERSERTALERMSPLVRPSRQEWLPAVFILSLDVVFWGAIYAAANSLRGVATPSILQMAVLGVLNLLVIVQALYIVGGYDRHIEMRSLFYTTEHLLALTSAAIFSAFLIYSIASYEQTQKPSRGVLLLSFLLFAPLSIACRRWVRDLVSQSSATRTFLVIGAGEAATQFYRTYQASPNRERLEFVDLDRERIGQPIAGPGSPLLEGDLATKLANLNERYSGVILAERLSRLKPELLEHLVRTQFQRTRVYTLESFYETHWRYVPLNAIDPVWPLQTGFQLARTSPYHYLKRLYDVGLSAGLLVICSPLIVLIAFAIWMKNGRPFIFTQSRVGRDDAPFTVYKFRTMAAATDEEAEGLYTLSADPRVTRLGRWLRKLRLDELPQLWNVVRGEMSLIGHRARNGRNASSVMRRKFRFIISVIW